MSTFREKSTYRAQLSALLNPCEEQLYNCRKKYIFDDSGEVQLIQTLVADKPIFNPHGGTVERVRKSVDKEKLLREREAIENDIIENMSSALDGRLQYIEREKRKSATYRAKRKVFDYAMANPDLKYFITLTLNGEEFSRTDIETAVKKLNKFLANRVQRRGLKYVIVPELHKDGAIHFHGLINNAVDLKPSGTYIPPHGGKPIKRSTLERKKIPLGECREVYNISDWKYGFTTAIEITGERKKVASYISKYITKDINFSENGKICGRYYFSSANLYEPFYEYENADFEAVEGYEIETDFLHAKIF